MANIKLAIDKEQLYKLYIEDRLSTKEIGKLLGCSQLTVINRLNEFSIQIRTISEANKGKLRSEEFKKLRSEYWTEEKRRKLSDKIKGVPKPRPGAIGKKIHSEKHKEYLSKKFSGENNPMFGRTGESNPNWKPPEERVTLLYKQIRFSSKYIEWRTSIFERDQYTCLFCKSKGGRLQVDHIKQFALILKENNISSKEDAEMCVELWDKTNARTLCYKCHRNTDTWGKRL